MKIFTNNRTAKDICHEAGVEVDEFSVEDTAFLGIDGIYIYENQSGMFSDVVTIENLKKLLKYEK